MFDYISPHHYSLSIWLIREEIGAPQPILKWDKDKNIFGGENVLNYTLLSRRGNDIISINIGGTCRTHRDMTQRPT